MDTKDFRVAVKSRKISFLFLFFQLVMSAFHLQPVGSHYVAFSTGHIQHVLGTQSHC